MINPNSVSTTDKPHQVEDAALKTMAQFFKDELLPYFDIDGEVDHIAPTETVHLELKKFYQDFNFINPKMLSNTLINSKQFYSLWQVNF